MPQAKKQPQKLEKHGDARVDDYFWLRERDTPSVIEYLEAENQHTNEVMRDTEALQKALYQEMRQRIKEDDASVPVPDSGYFYYSRFVQGLEYPIWARKKGSLEAPENILFDVNQMAKGHDYYSAGSPVVSPDHQLAALVADKRGRRFYDVVFRNLETGEFLPDVLPDTSGNLVWAADNKTVFFTKQDPDTLRVYQVFRYELGSHKPVLVYEEKDETFGVSVYGSKRDSFIFITADSTVSSEVQFVDAKKPTSAWQIIAPRERDHEYSVTDGGDFFYITTNWQAKNFRLMKASFDSGKKEEWQEVIPHRHDTLLEHVEVYKDYFISEERTGGLTQLIVHERASGRAHLVQMPDECYVAGIIGLPEYTSKTLRYSYESMVRPPMVLDYNLETHKAEVKKEKEVPTYKKELYVTKRLWATASDGVKIPISLVMRKDRPQKPGPFLLYGYGSYGLSMDPWFSTNSLSLLDRGFGFAIAHIRGGSEMGRHWYEDGKLLKKRNTFTDFIASAEFLVNQGYTSPEHLHIMGGSAGGLLMGTVINMRPDLFKSAVAAVPFVDVITTMLDESIPLTTSEYDEWGNPNVKEFYDYMKSYSPYDHIENKNYPNLLVTTGYHDSQVQYWEPAKWVAKLREKKTDKNLLLLKTEMHTGHSGASGRFERLKEVALHYAFFLKLENKLT